MKSDGGFRESFWKFRCGGNDDSLRFRSVVELFHARVRRSDRKFIQEKASAFVAPLEKLRIGMVDRERLFLLTLRCHSHFSFSRISRWPTEGIHKLGLW